MPSTLFHFSDEINFFRYEIGVGVDQAENVRQMLNQPDPNERQDWIPPHYYFNSNENGTQTANKTFEQNPLITICGMQNTTQIFTITYDRRTRLLIISKIGSKP